MKLLQRDLQPVPQTLPMKVRTSYNFRNLKIAGESINDIKFMRFRKVKTAGHRLLALP
jgi:hypothetical protein